MKIKKSLLLPTLKTLKKSGFVQIFSCYVNDSYIFSGRIASGETSVSNCDDFQISLGFSMLKFCLMEL